MSLLVYDASDGRLAARQEVTFGGRSNESTSEQSVLVLGNKVMVVNNFVGRAEDYRRWQLLINSQPFLMGRVAYGVAQYEFSERTQALTLKWMNPRISCASSIPTASADPATP